MPVVVNSNQPSNCVKQRCQDLRHRIGGHKESDSLLVHSNAGNRRRYRLFMSYVLASATAFMAGRYNSLSFRTNFLQPGPRITLLPKPDLASAKLKQIPPSLYSFRLFHSDSSSAGDSILLSETPPLTSDQIHHLHSYDVSADGAVSPSTFTRPHPSHLHKADIVDKLPGPSGHHLLVDIENVDATFLDSEDMLARAMLATVERGNLTMLSYHCHGMDPFGVSCVGVLLNGHLSLHTWPFPGVITMDLFTCESKPLLPFVDHLHALFGVPKQTPENATVAGPRARWAFKKRGFDPDPASSSPKNIELDEYIVGRITYEVKEKKILTETRYQTVEIFDLVDPKRHTLGQMKKSQSGDESYEARHPELFQPDRILFLDKLMQSRRYGEVAFHEALVHPAMLSHSNPKRVAIIGGGEGATLREVLKHKTVERVTMIEIDEAIVNISRTWLPEWSDCSTFGAYSSCFDDPRAEQVYYTDAVLWFRDRYANSSIVKESDQYDVIIMDALDPSSISSFSDDLYQSDTFLKALSCALGHVGVLVAQVGTAGFIVDDPQLKPGHERTLDDVFIPRLVQNGFAKVKSYTEAYSGFWENWNFHLAFKDARGNEHWHQSEAMTALKVRQRITPSKHGEGIESSSSSLRYFDGAVMRTFSYPSRFEQEVFCRKNPTPLFCDDNIVTEALDDERIYHIVHPDVKLCRDGFIILPLQCQLLHQMAKQRKDYPLQCGMDGFGTATSYYGNLGYYLSMCQHDDESQAATASSSPPTRFSTNSAPKELDHLHYSPVADRNHLLLLSSSN